MNNKPVTVVVAERAVEAMQEGDYCPRVEYLVRGLNGRIPDDPGGIRKVIKRARTSISRDYDLLVCCVSETYYSGYDRGGQSKPRKPFSEEPPKNDAEALLCLPGQTGGRIAGLYFVKERNDLIWGVYTGVYRRQGVIEQVVQDDNAFRGIQKGNLHKSALRRMQDMSVDAIVKKELMFKDKVLDHLEHLTERLRRLENQKE